MFEPRVPLLEIVLRVLLIYLFLLVLMRLFGKKEIGRWTPMEFLGMLLLARTVGPALTGGDSSLPVAGVGAATLLGITFLLDRLVYRSRGLERLIEGKPQLLIEDGRLLPDVMKRETLTEQQLLVANSGRRSDLFRRYGVSASPRCASALSSSRFLVSTEKSLSRTTGPPIALLFRLP